MVRLDSHLLPSFLAVADCLNFTEAAKQLGATQSGLSQHIAKLEESLGSSLFIRANKKIHLTPAGLAFRKFAESYLNHESTLFQELEGEKAALRGTVSYAMPESCLLTPHLDCLLKERSKHFPELKLKVTIDHHEEILRKVVDHEVDFGFCTLARPHPGLDYQEYCQEEYILVGNKKFQESISDLNKLAKSPFLLHPDFFDVMEVWWKQQKPKQAVHELNVIASLNNFLGIKTLLHNGAGVAIVPKQCVEYELSKKSLFPILPELSSVFHPIYIVSHGQAPRPRRVERVIEEFHAMIK